MFLSVVLGCVDVDADAPTVALAVTAVAVSYLSSSTIAVDAMTPGTLPGPVEGLDDDDDDGTDPVTAVVTTFCRVLCGIVVGIPDTDGVSATRVSDTVTTFAGCVSATVTGGLEFVTIVVSGTVTGCASVDVPGWVAGTTAVLDRGTGGVEVVIIVVVRTSGEVDNALEAMGWTAAALIGPDD